MTENETLGFCPGCITNGLRETSGTLRAPRLLSRNVRLMRTQSCMRCLSHED